MSFYIINPADHTEKLLALNCIHVNLVKSLCALLFMLVYLRDEHIYSRRTNAKDVLYIWGCKINQNAVYACVYNTY